MEAELGLHRAGRLAVDRQAIFGHARSRAECGGRGAAQAFDIDAQPMRARRDLALRGNDVMVATDVEVMHQSPGLYIKAVAGGGIAMSDQHALDVGIVDLDVRLDGVAAAAHIGSDVGGNVAHAGVKHEILARSVKARGVLGEARAEAIVERQHVVRFRLVPPQLDEFGEAFGLFCCEIVDLGEIAVEME